MTIEIVQRPVEGEWFIATWPCGTWCDWENRHGFAHKSDDYIKERVLTYDEGYVPVKTERVAA